MDDLKAAIETTKVCKGCGQSLPVTAFPAKTSRCRPCKASFDAGRKRDNPRDRSRNVTPAARERGRRKSRRAVYDAKVIARHAVIYAVRTGKLLRPSACEVCGNEAKRQDGVTAVQAHHDDYAKPLEVMWLCPPCHSAEHIRKGRK